MQMNKRNLGSTGIEVSQIAFGSASIGMPYGLNVCDDDMLSDEQAVSLLNHAFNNGINLFDTASGYGKSDELLGEAFSDKREKVVICGKPSPLYDSFLDQTLPSNAEIKKSLDKSIAQSLSRLKTDYIDIYMSHNGTEEVIENEAVIDFFQQKKQKGVIRATGVSVYTLEQSLAAINSNVWDVIQLQFNLMDQRQFPAIELAKANGIGIITRSVLFMGILTDRGANLHPKLKFVQDHRNVYNELLDDNTKSLPDLATKFVMSLDGISSVLIGIDKNEYLDKALSLGDSLQLSNEIMARAKQLAYPQPEFLNLPVWDRNGWLK